MDLCGGFWTSESQPDAMATLRVSGLGYSLAFGLLSSATVGDLKRRIEQDTRVPSEYQRLIARGSRLEDDEISLADAGIQDRTKILLLRNDLYAQEKERFEALAKLEQEIINLASEKETSAPAMIREQVTKICCKLDEVEIMGSVTLRARRKALLARAESLDDFTN